MTLFVVVPLAIALVATGAVFVGPITYRAGYRAALTDHTEGDERAPTTGPSAPAPSHVLSPLDLAALHGRPRRPALDPATYLDDQIARDPALERLTRRPPLERRPAHAGSHRAAVA